MLRRVEGEGGRLSEAQAAVKHHLEAARHGYLVSSSDYREVVETLKAWGVLRAGISVQWSRNPRLQASLGRSDMQ